MINGIYLQHGIIPQDKFLNSETNIIVLIQNLDLQNKRLIKKPVKVKEFEETMDQLTKAGGNKKADYGKKQFIKIDLNQNVEAHIKKFPEEDRYETSSKDERGYQQENKDEDNDSYTGAQDLDSKTMSKDKKTGKKCIFQNWQKDILKKWFIQHVDHPYLNDKSKLALIQKTGLDGKKISNWFMNVRKRIWQPVMKRGKNKNIKELMLKVRFKLDSSDSQLKETPSSGGDSQNLKSGSKDHYRGMSYKQFGDKKDISDLFQVKKYGKEDVQNHQESIVQPDNIPANGNALAQIMNPYQSKQYQTMMDQIQFYNNPITQQPPVPMAPSPQEAPNMLAGLKRPNPYTQEKEYTEQEINSPDLNKRELKQKDKIQTKYFDDHKKSVMRTFLNESKNLRFNEKMHNVMVWKKNQQRYVAKHSTPPDIPEQDDCDDDLNSVNKLEMIDKIEQQFAQKVFKMSDVDQQSTRQSQSHLFRENHPRGKQNGIDFGVIHHKNEMVEDHSNLNENLAIHLAPSNYEEEEFVSVPRSKSLSNNQSRCSFNLQEGCSNDFNQNQPSVQYIPIVLICCPATLKGKTCGCGYKGYFPANDFYKNQLSTYFNAKNKNNNVVDSSGSGDYQQSSSNFANSRNANPRGNNNSGSGGDPSNQQESGQSWRTTEANPLNFINLLNQVNCLVDMVEKNAKNLASKSKTSNECQENEAAFDMKKNNDFKLPLSKTKNLKSIHNIGASTAPKTGSGIDMQNQQGITQSLNQQIDQNKAQNPPQMSKFQSNLLDQLQISKANQLMSQVESLNNVQNQFNLKHQQVMHTQTPQQNHFQKPVQQPSQGFNLQNIIEGSSTRAVNQNGHTQNSPQINSMLQMQSNLNNSLQNLKNLTNSSDDQQKNMQQYSANFGSLNESHQAYQRPQSQVQAQPTQNNNLTNIISNLNDIFHKNIENIKNQIGDKPQEKQNPMHNGQQLRSNSQPPPAMQQNTNEKPQEPLDYEIQQNLLQARNLIQILQGQMQNNQISSGSGGSNGRSSNNKSRISLNQSNTTWSLNNMKQQNSSSRTGTGNTGTTMLQTQNLDTNNNDSNVTRQSLNLFAQIQQVTKHQSLNKIPQNQSSTEHQQVVQKPKETNQQAQNQGLLQQMQQINQQKNTSSFFNSEANNQYGNQNSCNSEKLFVQALQEQKQQNNGQGGAANNANLQTQNNQSESKHNYTNSAQLTQNELTLGNWQHSQHGNYGQYPHQNNNVQGNSQTSHPNFASIINSHIQQQNQYQSSGQQTTYYTNPQHNQTEQQPQQQNSSAPQNAQAITNAFGAANNSSQFDLLKQLFDMQQQRTQVYQAAQAANASGSTNLNAGNPHLEEQSVHIAQQDKAPKRQMFQVPLNDMKQFQNQQQNSGVGNTSGMTNQQQMSQFQMQYQTKSNVSPIQAQISNASAPLKLLQQKMLLQKQTGEMSSHNVMTPQSTTHKLTNQGMQQLNQQQQIAQAHPQQDNNQSKNQ